MAINSTSTTSSFTEHSIQLDLTAHGTDCPICLENIDPRDVSFTIPCHHKFDRKCIMEWVQIGTTEEVRCPSCRAVIENVIGAWDYVEELKLWMYGGLGKRFAEISRLIALQLELRLHCLERCSNRPRWLANSRLAKFPIVDSIYLVRRLLVYHFELRCKYVGSNPVSKYREVTCSTIAKDLELVEKARRFIKRELSILQYDLAEKERDKYVQGVINVICSVDLKSSGGRAELMIHETLKKVGRIHADIFAHELHSFLRSPHKTNLEWDSNAQYEARGGFPDLPNIDSHGDFAHQLLALLNIYQPRLANNVFNMLLSRDFAPATPHGRDSTVTTPAVAPKSNLTPTIRTPAQSPRGSTPSGRSHNLPLSPAMIWTKIHDHPNSEKCLGRIENSQQPLPDVVFLIIQVQRAFLETQTTLEEFEPRRLQRARPLSEMT